MRGFERRQGPFARFTAHPSMLHESRRIKQMPDGMRTSPSVGDMIPGGNAANGPCGKTDMADRSPICSTRSALVLFALLWLVACPLLLSATEAAAQTQLPGYAQAQGAFMRLTLDERVKLQILLTAAGYWPAVPDADFNVRLFNAILRFEVDNGFVPLGVLAGEQMDRLMAIAGPYLNTWNFQVLRHPMTNS